MFFSRYQQLLRLTTVLLGENAPLVTWADALTYGRALAAGAAPPDSFHVVDLSILCKRFDLWQQQLPEIEPFYAVKANPDPAILATLAALGTGFDCASQGEISAVLAQGVAPERIIFAHPRKSESAIRYAREKGISTLVFDSREELDKISALFPTAKLVLRIKTDDRGSLVPLSAKFGATRAEAKELIDYMFSRALPSPLVGISLHTGSNTLDPHAYARAISDAGELFKYCRTQHGHLLSLLDLGGGWVGEQDDLFAAAAAICRETLRETIPSPTRVIAEPGRFFAAATTLIAMKILGKKIETGPGPLQRSYYLANGAYGSFLTAITYQHNLDLVASEGFRFAPLFPVAADRPQYFSRLWGPTCDAYDRLVDLPLVDMASGDYIATVMAGAYSSATRTDFNGIEPSRGFYLFPAPSPVASPSS